MGELEDNKTTKEKGLTMTVGNLLHTEHSKIHATLEMLAYRGVTEEDFDLMRRYFSHLGEVVEVMTKLRGILEKAMGSDANAAIEAINQIDDDSILVDIIKKAVCLEAQLHAVGKIKDENVFMLYDVARLHPASPVVMVAVKRLGWQQLRQLVRGIGNEPWRQKIFNEEYCSKMTSVKY